MLGTSWPDVTCAGLCEGPALQTKSTLHQWSSLEHKSACHALCAHPTRRRAGTIQTSKAASSAAKVVVDEMQSRLRKVRPCKHTMQAEAHVMPHGYKSRMVR